MKALNFERFGHFLSERVAGHTLPQALYTDHDSFDWDQQAIFGQSWLMAGMECELPKPGSYMTMMVGQWPVLITRDMTGAVHAFHNSCRHRGSILCQSSHGAGPKLVCPYHRWTYNLDGTLFAAMRMPADFDKSTHGLKPINLRVVAGAIFICLADDAPPFDDFGNRFAEYAGPLNFADMKLAATDLMVEKANWKLVMENARECYHCGTGHPELAKTFPVAFAGHFDMGADERASQFAKQMDTLNLPHVAQEGDWWQIARFPLNEGASTISMDGQHMVRELLVAANQGDIGSLRWAIDPHLFAHATADHVFVFSCMPVSATETHVVSKWYVHKDAVEGESYDVQALKALWLKTNLQDRELAENNQRGVNSPGYAPGPYSQEAESMTQRFTDWYCTQAKRYVDAHV
jgi:glycine betaine catabolism A